jgi:hypothetical protein
VIYGQAHFFTKVGTFVLIFVEALSIEENIKALNKERGFQFYFNKLMATVKKGKKEITDIKKTL